MMYFKFTTPAQHAEFHMPGTPSCWYRVFEINSSEVRLTLSDTALFTFPLEGVTFVILSEEEMVKFKNNRGLDITQTFAESSYQELIGLEKQLDQAIKDKQAEAVKVLNKLQAQADEVCKNNGYHLTFIVE